MISVSVAKNKLLVSFCFGIYLENIQIGFARVIIDYVFFIDVMIKEPKLESVKN